MKTRIEILVATFAFIIGASVASWSQSQAASQTPRQRVAGNHSKTDHSKSNDVTAQTSASGATRTSQETKAKTGTADRIDVIGHLALPGATVTNLRTTEDSSLHMLEVTDSATGTLNFVDVSDPNHPKIVQRIQKPVQLENSRLEVAVGHAALFVETQDTTAHPVPRSVNIISFADSENPKTVRRFAGVTALLADHARGLIYLATPEGLWILQPYSVADRVAQEKEFEEMWRNAMTP